MKVKIFSWQSILWVLTLLAGVIWLSCVGIPLVNVISLALRPENQALLWSPDLLSIVRWNLWQACISTVISMILGTGLGLWVGALPHVGIRSWIQSLLMVPFGVPSIVAATAWVMWLGKKGLLAQLWEGFPRWSYGLSAVVLAHVFLNAPWFTALVSEARSGITSWEIEAAEDLGSTKVDVFFQVVWRRLQGTVLGLGLQVFSFCSMSFALVLILGGGPPVQTLETEIFHRIHFGTHLGVAQGVGQGLGQSWSGVSVYAFWQLLMTLSPWCLMAVMNWKKKDLKIDADESFFDSLQSGSPFYSLFSSNRSTFIGGLLGGLLAIVFLVPYFPVLDFSQLGGLFSGPDQKVVLRSLIYSLCISLGSGVFALIAGVSFMTALERLKHVPRLQRLVSVMIILPAGVSALVLGVGWFLAYENIVDLARFPYVSMVLLQMVLFYPFVFRSLWSLREGGHGTRRREVESAQGLGASDFQIFQWIEWPRWQRPVLFVILSVMGASLGEIAGVSLFSNDSVVPLGVLASHWMEQYHFEKSSGATTLLFLLSFSLIFGSRLFRRRPVISPMSSPLLWKNGRSHFLPQERIL